MAYRLGPPPEADEVETIEPDESTPDAQEQKALLRKVYQRAKDTLRLAEDWNDADQKGLYLINLNRSAAQTLFESRATVKADAAHRLFNINTTGISFAIIDGGIDARHPAFLKRSDDDLKKLLEAHEKELRETSGKSRAAREKLRKAEERFKADCLKFSRVLRTYDFTLVRDIVARAVDNAEITGRNRELIDRIFAQEKAKQEREGWNPLDHLKIRCDSARDLDWEILGPLIRVPHELEIDKDESTTAATPVNAAEENQIKYRIPGTDHGTHVAGILAADLPYDPGSGRQLEGMPPYFTL